MIQSKHMQKKILIIEDDSFLQGLISRKLKTDGFDVSIALKAADAFDLLGKGLAPDLFILDLLLPEIDGFEVLKRIRENPTYKSIPVIIFSNLSEEKDIKRVKDLGVSEFMIKANFTLDELSAKVKSTIK